ncbi:DUF2059 domain-containing protein [Croceitalea sp. MTPC6]|nr:hypothetical protein MTsPCn6_21950 [Croceitalea sp. MTPC6]
MKTFKTNIFVVLFFGTISLFSQKTEMVLKVSEYLQSNGTIKQYKDAYLELLNLMEKQFPKSDKNSDGWLYLQQNETKALTNINELLVPIYIKHFNEEDIDKMQSFYLGDTGQQLVQDRNKLTDAQLKEVDTFFSSKIGSKIKTKQQVLSEEIAMVSEYWSKDLYQTAVLLLKEE